MEKKILIADDDTGTKDIIKLALKKEGYEVVEASNGREAVDKFKEEIPDLIILDIGMPEIDGIEASRRMKLLTEPWTIPIIFVTAADSMEQKLLGLREGAFDYITKPFHPQELLARVENALKVVGHLKTISMIDGLTGLFNYNFFKKQMMHNFLLAERYKKDFSIIIADIDEFKVINDKYGHLAGDEVLKEVACRLTRGRRETDVVIRYGGDEFIIIMPMTNRKGGLKAISRMRKDMACFEMDVKDEKLLVNISFGLGSYSGKMQSEKEIFIQADKRLYAEKKIKKARAKNR